MSRRNSYSTLAVILLLVFSGCAGFTGGDIGSSNPATPDTGGDQAGTSQPTLEAPNGTLEVHFINVGQSVSTLLIGPTNETMLIDSGDFRDDGEYVLEYLKRHNIDRIDHFVVSHNDADHIGGNAAVINYFESEREGIGAVYDPGIAASTETYEEYLDAIERHDVTLYQTREGDPLQFDGVDVEVLGPPEPYLDSEGRNENSIVLHLTFGQTSFLFTGDAEDDQEQYLVDTYGESLQATILKAGHHGSDSSTSGALLDAVAPKAAIISSPTDSQYGHPHEAVLERLANREIPTYWTATHGTTVFVSDGSQVAVRTQQAAPTSPLELRDGTPIEPGVTEPVVQRAIYGGSDGQSGGTIVATDGGTETTSGGGELVLETIHADAEGDDRENLNDEYLVFENPDTSPLDLSGWTVEDEAGKSYTFPDGFTVDAGASVTLYTGSGNDNETALYWGAEGPVWNNRGDTVILTNDHGDEVLREEYS